MMTITLKQSIGNAVAKHSANTNTLNI